MKQWFSIAKQRWQSESPIFFKKLRKFAIWLGGVSVLTLVANQTLAGYGFVIIHNAIQWLGYIIIACGVCAGTTMFTTVNTTIIKDDKKIDN